MDIVSDARTRAFKGTGAWVDRHLRVVLGLAWLLVMSGAAIALIAAHDRSRAELEEKIELRADLAARFVGSYVNDLFSQEGRVARGQLFGREVSQADFERVAELLGTEAAVLLDDDGRLLQGFPSDPDLIGSNLSRKYAHLLTATEGEPAVSDVVPSAARGLPIIAFAVPFQASVGRRVFSGAFDVTSSPFSEYLSRAVAIAPNRVDLIDSAGTTLASSELGVPVPELPSVAEAADENGTSTSFHGPDDEFVAVQTIAGTPWRVVLSAPESNLYQPIGGFSRLLPWLLWLGLAAGGLICIVLVGRLVESRRQLEMKQKELERANGELGRFAGIAAHDLANPLRTISGFAQLLQRRNSAELDARSNDQLERIVGGAKRMRSLIDDLLLFARSDQLNIEPEAVDLGDVVEEVVLGLEHDISEQSARVEFGPLPRVLGDRGQLAQLMQNLIVNALKFKSDAPAVIEVSAERSADGWLVAVADNGVGIPDDEREGIFDPFGRVGDTADRPGSGLGLAICARIVGLHGGRIWSEPNQPAGTRFNFSLLAQEQVS